MRKGKSSHHVKGLPMSLENSTQFCGDNEQDESEQEIGENENEISTDVLNNGTDEMTRIPEITTEELRTVINKLKRGKSPDSTGICEHHTSQITFFSLIYTHMRGSSRVFVVRASLVMIHLHALVCLFRLSSTSPLSSLCCPSSLLSSCPSSCPATSSSRMWWTNSLCTPANEDLGTLAEYDPLTGYEPNDYHISEATEPYIQESSVENGSPNDFEYDDATIGKALSSPLFTKEREDDGRAYHSQDEGLSSSPSVMIEGETRCETV